MGVRRRCAPVMLGAVLGIFGGLLGGCADDDPRPVRDDATVAEAEAGFRAQREEVRDSIASATRALLADGAATLELADGGWRNCTNDSFDFQESSDVGYQGSGSVIGAVSDFEARARAALEAAGFRVEETVAPEGQRGPIVRGRKGDLVGEVQLYEPDRRLTVHVQGPCLPIPEPIRAKWTAVRDDEAEIPIG